MSAAAQRFIYRDIAWLAFNERVLQEAEDPTVPILERVKFLGIFSNNQDEFYRVRVDYLKKMSKLGAEANVFFNSHPRELLEAVQAIVLRLRDRFEKAFKQIVEELEKQNIVMLNENQLNAEQGAFVKSYFQEKVRPTLFPIMLAEKRQFPELKDQTIYLAIRLIKHLDNGNTVKHYSALEIPIHVPRFLVLPAAPKQHCIILLDDVIRYNIDAMYSIYDFDYAEAYTIKVTRGAELDIDNDILLNLLETLKSSLKRRETADPTRLVFDKQMPEDFKQFVIKKMKLKKLDAIISGGRYHNFKDFIKFPPPPHSSHLKYPPLPTLPHPYLHGKRSIMAVLRQKDILLSFPYQSFTYFLDLLREAAIDPHVTAIYSTYYRVAQQSNVMGALINAVQNGKKVVVIAELQARFDEEANIYWADKLKASGVQVIYGVKGLKVHAKVVLIERKEHNNEEAFVGISTGNFNEATSSIYADHMLMTSQRDICKEVQKLFEFFEDNMSLYSFHFKHLWVAPFSLRNEFNKLLTKAIKTAKSGKNVSITLKVNSLVDENIIKKLYEANAAGVKIRLMVRSICSLVPQQKFSKNIQAFGLLDNFLEHARVYHFNINGENHIYIGSADLMRRNLDNRIEVMCPIKNPDLQQHIIEVLEIEWRDNIKARIWNKELSNEYKKRKNNEKSMRAQQELYKFFEAFYTKNIPENPALSTKIHSM